MSNQGLLGYRQQTTDILLKLSRSLAIGQNRGDIVGAIAGTIRQLLGETTATAIWNRRDQTVEMIGNEGFGKKRARSGHRRPGRFVRRSGDGTEASGRDRKSIATSGDQNGSATVTGRRIRRCSEPRLNPVVTSPEQSWSTVRRCSWTDSDLSLIASLAGRHQSTSPPAGSSNRPRTNIANCRPSSMRSHSAF